MRQMLLLVAALGMIVGSAQALVTSDVIDWNGDRYFDPPINGSDTYLGEGFKVLFGADWLGSFRYNHTISLDPTGYWLQSATLSLTHVGNVNQAMNPELWLASTNGGHFIGLLSQSSWGSWKTDSWTLSQDILNEMNSSAPWSLGIALTDPTWAPDALMLDRSVLTVNYTAGNGGGENSSTHPIPEPTTALLLGMGLVGFGIGLRKKRSPRT